MNVRSVNTRLQPRTLTVKDNHRNQRGFVRIALLLAIVGVLAYATVSLLSSGHASADGPQPQIRSAIGDVCLDDYRGATKAGTEVDAWQCNGTTSQAWMFISNKIILNNKYCLAENSDKAVLEVCNQSANQQWTRDGVGFKNKNDKKCLSVPSGKLGVQLILSSCNQLTSINESWTPDNWPGKPLDEISSPACNQYYVGDRVACNAERQWLAWQTEPALHHVLLSNYTDGNSYEEWCADFVSFIYAESGAPFTGGERGNGWDEYDANNIQNMGFTYHAADSGYVPKPGDVAYFNYSGGHVEIVVKGGTHPTFIYGDSGTIDPITNNGDMAKNQITSDGSNGSLQYYLSPS